MGGFHTLDESHAYAHFRRGRIFHVLGHVKLSGVTYDWTGSLFNQTTIAGTTSIWNSPDVWNGAGENDRGPNTQNYRNNMVAYVDTSGDDPELKLAHCGHTGHSADDFQELETGIKAKSGNNELVILSSNGLKIVDNNIEDETHFVRWKHKHDAKSDTHFTTTAVLTCSSNVISAYTHWQSPGTLQSGNYVDAATAISSGTLYWQITWDPDDNTWTVNTSDDDWQQSNNGNVSITTDGGTIGKYTTQYSITGSSPADGRMWEITIGEV